MAIHKDRRIPPVEHPCYDSPDLGRFSLHCIPVQIEELAVMPYTHPIYRSVLVSSVKWRNLFISVRIEVWAYQYNRTF